MMALLVTVVVLLSITLIILVVGVFMLSRRLADVSSEMTQTMKAMRESVVPAAQDASKALGNVDLLVSEVRAEVRQISRIIEMVERLLEGRTVVAAASRAVASSKTTLTSVFEGLKEGLKAIKSLKKDHSDLSNDAKEEPKNE